MCVCVWEREGWGGGGGVGGKRVNREGGLGVNMCNLGGKRNRPVFISPARLHQHKVVLMT